MPVKRRSEKKTERVESFVRRPSVFSVITFYSDSDDAFLT